MAVEFLLLGNIEVFAFDTPIPLPSTMVRGLLATLLLRPNQFVPAETIHRRLWFTEPASAASNLRTYVTTLRRAIPDTAGGSRLTGRRRHGYRLTVDPGECDLPLFHSAAEEGRRYISTRQFEKAIPPLEAALGLWRGIAGEDIPQHGTLAPTFHALNESHLNTIEGYAEARLAMGHARHLIPDLRIHLTDQPLRERACALLMEALCRVGDPAGAMQAYEHLRAALDRDLKIEPQNSLSRLRDMIAADNLDVLR